MPYEISPWVAIVVIALTIWRAFHGPYGDRRGRGFRARWWRSHRPPPA